jgi:FAD-dependent urate hydroxylase
MTSRTADTSVAIIGAGPHGLAAAAHLRSGGVDIRIFGDTMQFWREQMPAGMLLRSSRRASHIADPHRRLTLDDWARASGRAATNPVTLDEFVEYGSWYQREAVPDVDPRYVRSVAAEGDGFRLVLEDGIDLRAKRVVVAAGIAAFPYVPPELEGLPPELVSHSSSHPELGVFAGRRVAVLGGGQSALESAALLHEGGAQVELIARTASIWWLSGPPAKPRRRLWRAAPTDVGGRVTSWLVASPDIFRLVPRRVRPDLSFRCIRPAGAHWLRERVVDVPFELGRTVVSASPNGALTLALSDGSRREVDHLLLGTGFDVDVRRYPFLAPELKRELRLAGGYPLLRRGLESSVAGVHFVGATAAHSFGPVMRFVTGSWYTAPAVTQRIQGRRRPLVRWSF